MVKKNKAIKISAIAAVAFMPAATIATPAFAENVYGVDTAQPANYFFNNLTPTQQGVLKTVVNTAGNNIGLVIKDSYTFAGPLTSDMQSLLSPSFNDANVSTLEADLTQRYTNFVNNSSIYLSTNPANTKAELASFINGFVLQMMQTGSQVTGSNIAPFMSALQNKIADPSTPQEIKDAFDFTTQDAATFATNIQNAVNAYYNSLPGGGTPPPTEEPPVDDNGEGEVTASPSTVENNPEEVIETIESADEVEEFIIELEAGDDSVAIPATIFNALEDKNEEAVITVRAEEGSFSLPVSSVDLSSLAAELGVTTPELFIIIEVSLANTQPTTVEGMDVLAPAVEFTVIVSTSPNPTASNSIELDLFPYPIERKITASTPVFNTLTSVGGVLMSNGTFVPKPTYISNVDSAGTETATADEGFGNGATISSNTNSVYVVLENFQTFIDVDGGKSWSEEFVEKLASRMIVNGVNENEFKPSNFITRGEFAALLSRGLGIEATVSGNGTFTDVNTSQAANKNGEVYAAVDAGIILGYGDDTFRPYERITRDQAAIMISRAISYLGDDKVNFVEAKDSSDFEDYAEIGATARPHVERVYEAGYIDGFLDDTFRPGAETNRAQMAKILYNFLQSVKFIN